MSSLHQRLLLEVKKVFFTKLTWKEPFASQIISDSSEIEPKFKMQPLCCQFFQKRCRRFVSSFIEHQAEAPPEKLSTLEDSWNNLAFGPDYAESQNEGTYVTNVIKPMIRASLKDIPYGSSLFVKKFHELMRSECSRLFCSEQKQVDDEVKVWRETNDDLYWTRKTLKPDRSEFGIGVLVAGNILHLNVLIRDEADIHRYYHLRSAKTPVQFANAVI
ncbi:12776_t:CDS:2, partial [Racocetra persica]